MMKTSTILNSILAISAGASFGATSRWLLGLALNNLFPPIPMGTLAANLIGGYFIGFLMGLFVLHPSISPEWKLFAITGFLGSLTTFSAFSAETVALLQEGHIAMAAAASALHLFGSLIMTFLGLATFAMVKHLWD